MIGESVAVRPWVRTGLEYLLTESEDRVRELSCSAPLETREEKAMPAPAVQNGPAGMAYGKRGAFSPSVQRDARDKASASSADGRAKASSFVMRPFGSWGAEWQHLWKKLNMDAHPRVVWTYAGLGEDLTGTASTERRAVMAHILKGLGHPRGTHGFWPYVLPGTEPEPDIFWSALSMAGTRAVLVFGSEARDALFLPKTLRPYCQEIFQGRMVIQLQRPESLYSDEAGLRKLVLNLTSLLRRCLPVRS